MGKMVYQKCVVLKMLRWKDDRFIVTLLGKKWCVFSAIWTLPKSKKTKKFQHPELFQNIEATLQVHIDGLHRLRDYRECPSPERQELEHYLGLNLMARYFLLSCEEAPDPGPWHIWQRHQKNNLLATEARLNLVAELCYHNGTWPAGDFCENCNKTLDQKAYLEFASLSCQKCQVNGFLLKPESHFWLQHKFLLSRTQAPVLNDQLHLLNWLKKRLPDQCLRDRIFRKLWQQLAL